MKRGYKRLLVFELLIFLVLVLNSFVWNILDRYTILLFLALVLILFKVFFGFEKDKHRYVKDVILDTLIFLIIYFMLYYLFGIIIGFARTGNHYTLYGLKTFFLPIICLVILTEYLRYVMMCKAEDNRFLIVVTTLVFISLDVSSAIYYAGFNSTYEKFIFIALTLLPSISKNVGFSVLVLKIGYKPLILYQLVMSLYFYFLPIAPNPNEYLSSVIQFCVPIIYIYKEFNFLNKNHDEDVDRDYRKKRVIPISMSFLLVIVLVYFTSGYFHFWAIAVASGSMSPKINKGDVVFIEKIDGNYSKLKIGDVVAYKYKEVVVVHRLVNVIVDKDKYYFYTKGDANSKEDDLVIDEDMIVGKVDYKVPFIGIPTVWLNEI